MMRAGAALRSPARKASFAWPGLPDRAFAAAPSRRLTLPPTRNTGGSDARAYAGLAVDGGSGARSRRRQFPAPRSGDAEHRNRRALALELRKHLAARQA